MTEGRSFLLVLLATAVVWADPQQRVSHSMTRPVYSMPNSLPKPEGLTLKEYFKMRLEGGGNGQVHQRHTLLSPAEILSDFNNWNKNKQSSTEKNTEELAKEMKTERPIPVTPPVIQLPTTLVPIENETRLPVVTTANSTAPQRPMSNAVYSSSLDSIMMDRNKDMLSASSRTRRRMFTSKPYILGPDSNHWIPVTQRGRFPGNRPKRRPGRLQNGISSSFGNSEDSFEGGGGGLDMRYMKKRRYTPTNSFRQESPRNKMEPISIQKTIINNPREVYHQEFIPDDDDTFQSFRTNRPKIFEDVRLETIFATSSFDALEPVSDERKTKRPTENLSRKREIIPTNFWSGQSNDFVHKNEYVRKNPSSFEFHESSRPKYLVSHEHAIRDTPGQDQYTYSKLNDHDMDHHISQGNDHHISSGLNHHHSFEKTSHGHPNVFSSSDPNDRFLGSPEIEEYYFPDKNKKIINVKHLSHQQFKDHNPSIIKSYEPADRQPSIEYIDSHHIRQKNQEITHRDHDDGDIYIIDDKQVTKEPESYWEGTTETPIFTSSKSTEVIFTEDEGTKTYILNGKKIELKSKEVYFINENGERLYFDDEKENFDESSNEDDTIYEYKPTEKPTVYEQISTVKPSMEHTKYRTKSKGDQSIEVKGRKNEKSSEPKKTSLYDGYVVHDHYPKNHKAREEGNQNNLDDSSRSSEINNKPQSRQDTVAIERKSHEKSEEPSSRSKSKKPLSTTIYRFSPPNKNMSKGKKANRNKSTIDDLSVHHIAGPPYHDSIPEDVVESLAEKGSKEVIVRTADEKQNSHSYEREVDDFFDDDDDDHNYSRTPTTESTREIYFKHNVYSSDRNRKKSSEKKARENSEEDYRRKRKYPSHKKTTNEKTSSGYDENLSRSRRKNHKDSDATKEEYDYYNPYESEKSDERTTYININTRLLGKDSKEDDQDKEYSEEEYDDEYYDEEENEEEDERDEDDYKNKSKNSRYSKEEKHYSDDDWTPHDPRHKRQGPKHRPHPDHAHHGRYGPYYGPRRPPMNLPGNKHRSRPVEPPSDRHRMPHNYQPNGYNNRIPEPYPYPSPHDRRRGSPPPHGPSSRGPPPPHGPSSRGPPPPHGPSSRGPPPPHGPSSRGPPPPHGPQSRGPPPPNGPQSRGPPPSHGPQSRGPPPSHGPPSRGPPSRGPPPSHGPPSRGPPPPPGVSSRGPPPSDASPRSHPSSRGPHPSSRGPPPPSNSHARGAISRGLPPPSSMSSRGPPPPSSNHHPRSNRNYPPPYHPAPSREPPPSTQTPENRSGDWNFGEMLGFRRPSKYCRYC